MKKYELTDDTTTIHGIKLSRIKALRNFGDVKKGDLGGYIQSEDNLRHHESAWVAGDSQVFENAWVAGNGVVYGNAQVFGKAEVFGKARVFGNTEVSGNAEVSGNTEEIGRAHV